MKQLNVGIAGYGIVGQRRRMYVDKHPSMKLIAVCDKSFKESGQISGEIKSYNNYKELIQEDLDVLIVCMTNDIASEVTIAGLKQNLHVFCEKPPGRNLNDLIDVMKVEKECGDLVLMYGFNHRYHDSVQEALRVIRGKDLGKIINLRGVYGKSKIVTFNQSDWRTKRSIAGGGVLLDQGIHMVDLMRLFAGEFTEVQSLVTNSYWNYDVEDNAYALMKTDDGIVGMLHSSATQWRHRFNLDINLEGGSLVLGGLLTGTKSYGAETLLVASVDHELDSGNPQEQITSYNNDPSWELELNSFCESIINGTRLEHGSSQDALDTMKLVFRIYYADPDWRKKYKIPDPELI